MKKFLKSIIITFIFISIFSTSYADEKILILDYGKNKIDKNLLKIDTNNEKIAEIFDDGSNKKFYLNILDNLNKNEIIINFEYKGRKLNYKYIHNPKFPIYLDISNKFKFKRLQKRPLSCESSVTADVLSYLSGKEITEYDVSNKIDKTYLNFLPFGLDDKLFWGNPNVGFVGYIDYYGERNNIKPTQRDMTGYGIYEIPISKIYKTYGFESEIITRENYSNSFKSSDHLTVLLKNLAKGNMVQLWGDWCTREEYDDGTIKKSEVTQEKVDNKIYAKNYCTTTLEDRKMEWYYIENFEIKKHVGLIGEHAFYLLGYEGGVENPSKIIVWDSDTGYHKLEVEEWMRKWSLMDYKSIIVKKKL